MHASFDSLLPLAMLAAVLGLKHGMDADHLATIDGLTRYNSIAGRQRLARWCGFLFSLGHGLVVCLVAVAASVLFKQAALPEWLDGVGSWVSIVFLLLLGALNLNAVFSAAPGEMVAPIGFKGRFLRKLNRAGHPLLVALVGALFAVSFDTLSQATLFSAASANLGGAPVALSQALCFMFGMMTTDAINGLWISQLLRRADRNARIASRIMGITVAMLSFAVAALGLSRLFSPQAAAWQGGSETAIGMLVIAVVAASFLLAFHRQKRAQTTVS